MGWIIVLSLLIPVSVALFTTFGISPKISTSDFILLITAAFVLVYTYGTRKLREETVFQREMSVANDIQFYVYGGSYSKTVEITNFGRLTTAKSLNNICKFSFMTAIIEKKIGECSHFYTNEDENFYADYYFKSDADRMAFLEALQIQNGRIKARVLITNGTRFIYTFEAMGSNWQRALKGEPPQGSSDNFILVKKELDPLN
jgi:hypothetical protein